MQKLDSSHNLCVFQLVLCCSALCSRVLRGPSAPLASAPPEEPRASLLQVDALKAKLATQEVELKQKNEDADKLIRVVGVETEKVSREKAVADEEEQRVALIMLEVERKRKDCEEDLAKAEPALTAAQEALNTLNKVRLPPCSPGQVLEEMQWPRDKRATEKGFQPAAALTGPFIKQMNV